ncbi:catalase-peroxidase, partial [Francisella tularensis subsp. holarctica]|nr:catalase-peroxidase [Francisella tularensis subsp. holarctica]
LSPDVDHQWNPTNSNTEKMVHDAHNLGVNHNPIMFTTDLALKEHDGFNKYTQEFYNNHEDFKEEIAKAWFKIKHRYMG